MADPTDKTPKPSLDEICRDREILRQKEKILGREKWASSLNFASGMTGMFSGPLVGAGLFGLLAALGASQAVPMAAIVIIAVGATLSLAGMAINYVQSRQWHDINFDNMELSAARHAKHLVKELKANNLCLTEHEQNCRADGKKWEQVVRGPQQQQLRPQG